MAEFSQEQIFIVTGASSGIGEAVALLLNEQGATVVAIARNEERLLAMKDKCKNPDAMHIEIKDLTEDIEGLPTYVKSLKEKYGKFSGCAYCAGIGLVTPVQLATYADFKNVFAINYFAPIMMTKGLVDKRNNIGRGSSFVYVSSIAALDTGKGQSVYAGSKAALSSSIKVIAKEISKLGMRANCVLPAMIKTPMTVGSKSAEDLNSNEENDKETYPFGWGEPSDVANLIAFLLSSKSKFISGQNYIVDSGMVY